MHIEDLIRRSAVTLPLGASMTEAARLMKENDMGSVVVMDGERLVGILTDRDIVLGPVADERNPSVVPVEYAMTPNVVFLPVGSDVEECLTTLESHGVRRMPVVDKDGSLVGVVSLDDLLLHLGRQMAAAASLIRKELVFVPATTARP